MLGAIYGDMCGSFFEHHNVKSKTVDLWTHVSRFTDDTVLTVATMEAILEGVSFAERYRSYFQRYPHAGFGSGFANWARSGSEAPYNSYGNGAAMRVSPVAWACDTLEEVLQMAAATAEVTHNHPEGVKGAKAIAGAAFLTRQDKDRDAVRSWIETTFNYDLSESIDSIRSWYKFDASCQGSVPQAIRAWLESTSLEDAIRNAISIGGDSDTLACMAGAIAEAEFGLTDNERYRIFSRLDPGLSKVVQAFYKRFVEA
jgi:ADP-ribosylglycohydrolase